LPSQLVHHLNHNPSGRYSQSAWSRWQSYSTQTRGQFLLTGSANILTLPTVADALPGRVQYVNLSPLSQGELHGTRDHILDSGLLSFLIGANERRIAEDGPIAGAMLESFVAMELLRQSDWAEEPVRLFHYRDKQQREVDVILERHSGELVGIEVKAAATPTSADFAGLRYLRDKLGARFKAGALIYTGADTLPFG
jgi:predicted AAA+ superfamily ATPase